MPEKPAAPPPTAAVNKLLTHSLVDGPGNRAVVFLQGCNLHCQFCHNPQTINVCTHCGACVPLCPAGALVLRDGRVIWDPQACQECDNCTRTCPHFSTPRVHHYTPVDLWEAIAPFAPFLAGVAVSGGEPLLQVDFLLHFFAVVKTHSRLTTFIETNGAFPVDMLEPLLPLLDGALVDFKVYDPAAHLDLTGADNIAVRDTIRFLSDHGRLNAVRQTVIPGINADVENAANTARFLAEIDPAIRLRFLRFRPHGTRGEAQHWSSPDNETLEKLADIARAQGLVDVAYSL
jgi:pyruvate formate lyase activating enzyme